MKPWRLEYTATARRALRKLDRQIAAKVIQHLEEVAASGDPRSKGKDLKGSVLGGRWRYRVQDWRIIVHLHDHLITIEVLTIGHRSDVYL